MICVSLLKDSVDQVVNALKSLTLAEVRLETLPQTEEMVKTVFNCKAQIVATNRVNDQSEQTRQQVLLWAVENGAAYVDVEIESEQSFKQPIIEKAKKEGCKVIVSYHNYNTTPSKQELDNIIKTCFEQGADIAKVACLAKTEAHAARILGLADDSRTVLPIGMGKKGQIVRIAAPFVGSPFTFACLPEEQAAPGQIEQTVLEKVYRDSDLL